MDLRRTLAVVTTHFIYPVLVYIKRGAPHQHYMDSGRSTRRRALNWVASGQQQQPTQTCKQKQRDNTITTDFSRKLAWVRSKIEELIHTPEAGIPASLDKDGLLSILPRTALQLFDGSDTSVEDTESRQAYERFLGIISIFSRNNTHYKITPCAITLSRKCECCICTKLNVMEFNMCDCTLTSETISIHGKTRSLALCSALCMHACKSGATDITAHIQNMCVIGHTSVCRTPIEKALQDRISNKTPSGVPIVCINALSEVDVRIIHNRLGATRTELLKNPQKCSLYDLEQFICDSYNTSTISQVGTEKFGTRRVVQSHAPTIKPQICAISHSANTRRILPAITAPNRKHWDRQRHRPSRREHSAHLVIGATRHTKPQCRPKKKAIRHQHKSPRMTMAVDECTITESPTENVTQTASTIVKAVESNSRERITQAQRRTYHVGAGILPHLRKKRTKHPLNKPKRDIDDPTRPPPSEHSDNVSKLKRSRVAFARVFKRRKPSRMSRKCNSAEALEATEDDAQPPRKMERLLWDTSSEDEMESEGGSDADACSIVNNEEMQRDNGGESDTDSSSSSSTTSDTKDSSDESDCDQDPAAMHSFFLDTRASQVNTYHSK